ncbi:MAG: TonB-dependent receptor [Winogradskyella sp.]
MKKLLLVFTLLSSFAIFSQSKSFEISGILKAADTKEALESATIYLERLKDSSVVTYTISDKEGKFKLENSTYDNTLNLYISYVGYKTFLKEITIDKKEIDLKTIYMAVDDNQLGEVLIKSKAPITIKKDTLEFNVSSFKTKKDASVEDLLKKLPGVEVDDEGQITVNGKPVNKILVNGKPFFGDDPTITTRNLTKEIIEKVQIVDTKTKSEAFSGEEGDKENKTINLTIKEENNKGQFGRVSAGKGTDDRWEFAGLINFFDNDRRLSVLAGGNNTNSPGFSFGEIQKMFGGGNSISVSSNGAFSIDGRSFGGGQGIVTSKNVGANYADVLSKGVDISADYFYTESDSENETKVDRENILPDTRFFTNSRGKSLSDNSNHSFNSEFDIEIDSTFLVNIRPSFRFGLSQQISENSEETFDINNNLSNSSSVSNFSESTVRNFSNDIDVTKRFGDKGSFLKFNFETQFNRTDRESFLRSETLIEDPNEEDILRDQFTESESKFNRLRLGSTFRLPLIPKTFFIDAKISHLSDNRNNVNSTFDIDTNTDQYSLFNTELSTDFRFFNIRTTPSLDLVYRKDDWSFSLETGYVFRTLENRDQLRPELSLKETFEAVELGSNFFFKFSDKASMYGGYSLSNRPPEISQLQPFQDVSDPLNTVTGNPNLEPANSHSLYTGYNSFDFQKGTGFYSYLNLDITNNQVVARTTVNNNFVRNTTYTNVNGNYRVSGSMSYSKKVKLDSVRELNIRVGTWGNMSRNVNFNNDIQFASRNVSFTPNMRLTFNWKKVLEISPNYRVSFTRNTFNLPDFEDQEFLSHNLRINTALFVPKKFEWRNDINYNYNPNVAPGFQRSVWFWNSTLAYSFLNDKATVTLKAYDLLNQNNNARRSANANFIQDTQSTVLRRFFMLSFSYKFNSLGDKGKVNDGPMFFF